MKRASYQRYDVLFAETQYRLANKTLFAAMQPRVEQFAATEGNALFGSKALRDKLVSALRLADRPEVLTRLRGDGSTVSVSVESTGRWPSLYCDQGVCYEIDASMGPETRIRVFNEVEESIVSVEFPQVIDDGFESLLVSHGHAAEVARGGEFDNEAWRVTIDAPWAKSTFLLDAGFGVRRIVTLFRDGSVRRQWNIGGDGREGLMWLPSMIVVLQNSSDEEAQFVSIARFVRVAFDEAISSTIEEPRVGRPVWVSDERNGSPVMWRFENESGEARGATGWPVGVVGLVKQAAQRVQEQERALAWQREDSVKEPLSAAQPGPGGSDASAVDETTVVVVLAVMAGFGVAAVVLWRILRAA